MQRMFMVSTTFLISTVQLAFTLVMVKGPWVGAFIFGWLRHSSELRMIRILSPGEYCLARQEWLSFWLEAATNLWCSWLTVSQSIFTAWWKIISWLKSKWQGECLMLGLMLVQTACAKVSKGHCISLNQLDQVKVIIYNMFIVRWTLLMTPLLLGFLMVFLETPVQQNHFHYCKLL